MAIIGDHPRHRNTGLGAICQQLFTLLDDASWPALHQHTAWLWFCVTGLTELCAL